MRHWQEELVQAVARWRELGRPVPDVALVAGSGLSVDLGVPIAGPEPLADWLPFPVLSVPGHRHEVELLELPGGRRVLYFRGRIHGYQGYTPADVVFPIRFAALLGTKTLVMTNAAGGVRPEWPAGTLAAVSDQLNLTGGNPLSGDPPAAWGARFPDMLDAFDPGLRELAGRRARDLGFELQEGVYAGLNGPSYETPAEVRMLRILGADLVGMSTVHEIVAARHLGMKCLVLSLVANPGAGVTDAPLHHEEVLEAGRAAASRVKSLLAALLGDPALD
ncbi:MAG: purine-nucleoside phosphorylase [Thermoanaerobaculia bacterium]|jgi:purine-nucleoside phosphorylase|nr:purine-nucleoside phosphorylase [Thermoanaerobaculia bacterium]MBP9825956.1 purine-nucleoside phosphorylase [Thermoanaerobaculia bacterium]